MNILKKNGGFTLVELIVVIAILAILAGVAVPAYSGYIARANDAACLSELSAIHTAAQAACSLEGTSVKSISIATSASTGVSVGDITVTGADDETYKISEFYTAPSTLMTTLAKHSNYETASSDGISWSESAGWDLLADSNDDGE